MNRHAFDLIYHRAVVEGQHTLPDDPATRTPPVFQREAAGFQMPTSASRERRSRRRQPHDFTRPLTRC